MERSGWSIVLVSIIGFLIWIILAFLLSLSIPAAQGEQVWTFYPFMIPLAALFGLLFFIGFVLVLAAHFEKGKVEIIYY